MKPKLLISHSKHQFKIDEEVFVFAPNCKIKKKYQWSKKLRDPKENLKLDEKKSGMAKNKTKKRMKKMIQFIIDNVKKQNTIILDIATGRGLLLRNLIPVLNNCTIYLNDISTNVLVGTNKLVKPLLGSNTIFPIQSSAVHMPFSNESFSNITSFGPNNIRPTTKAFKEIYRALKRNGNFIFSISLIEKSSPSYQYLVEHKENPSKLDLIDEWQSEVKKIGFKIKKQIVLFDGPVEKIPLDIIPRENGERLQNIGVILTKTF